MNDYSSYWGDVIDLNTGALLVCCAKHPDYVVVKDVIVEDTNTANGQINFALKTEILPIQVVEKVFFFDEKILLLFICRTHLNLLNILICLASSHFFVCFYSIFC
jgi:hypothetical protein